jgi:hypothetical protein
MVEKKDVNSLVRYYDGGWYVGYLVKVTKTSGVIQPIAAYKGKKPHPRTFPLSEIERAE